MQSAVAVVKMAQIISCFIFGYPLGIEYISSVQYWSMAISWWCLFEAFFAGGLLKAVPPGHDHQLNATILLLLLCVINTISQPIKINFIFDDMNQVLDKSLILIANIQWSNKYFIQRSKKYCVGTFIVEPHIYF